MDDVANSLPKDISMLCFIKKKKKKLLKSTDSLFSYKRYLYHKIVFLVNELIYSNDLLLLSTVPNGVYVVSCDECHECIRSMP